MKLAKAVSNEPSERFAISMKASAHASLKSYQDFYRQTYGEDITMNQLVENMLVEFMKDDKDFQKVVGLKASTQANRAPKLPNLPL